MIRIDDKLLIWRFNRGDRCALQKIYQTYRDDMLKVAGALLLDRGSIEDVVQDVFVAFARQSGSFQLRGSLKGYLAISIANRARDCNRKLHYRRAMDLDQCRDIPAKSVPPGRATEQLELFDIIAREMEHLPDDQKEVIVLRLQGQMRFKDIARVKDVSIQTIQSRYRYGIEKLRNTLNGEMKR